MKALVTGASGFLGGCLIRQLLAKGWQVRGLSRRPAEGFASADFEMTTGDICNAEAVANACAGVDIVFHTAAIAGVWGPWKRFYETNVVGTENVLAGCKRHGVEHLVYTSSPSVTFDGSDQSGVDESAPYPDSWLCHYPHTKSIAERQVLAASNELKTCALRPHLIWGPGDPHLIPRLIDRARSGRLRRIGDGENRIDMVHVENAAHAHVLAADNLLGSGTANGKAYFISQDEPVNCWLWIDEILVLANLPPLEKTITRRSAWFAAIAAESIWTLLRKSGEPPLTRFVVAQMATDHWFDLTAAKRDLGYTPIVSTIDGMQTLAEDIERREL